MAYTLTARERRRPRRHLSERLLMTPVAPLSTGFAGLADRLNVISPDALSSLSVVKYAEFRAREMSPT